MLFEKASIRQRGLICKGGHLPYNPANVARARILRRKMTPEEKKLWFGFLRYFKYRVYNQRPIDHYIADFYCPKLKLVIEIDGKHHHYQPQARYDRYRSNVLEAYGLSILRIDNEDIQLRFDEICKMLDSLELE